MPLPEVLIYTDGGCRKNPGPGGYGVVLLSGNNRKEMSGGYRRTTNNRMEMMAAIVALRSLKMPCRGVLYSDSLYLVNAVRLGWAENWRANNWLKKVGGPAKNIDLWEELLPLVAKHEIAFRYVPGHAGQRENERCDELARQAARGKDLPEDEGFDGGRRRR